VERRDFRWKNVKKTQKDRVIYLTPAFQEMVESEIAKRGGADLPDDPPLDLDGEQPGEPDDDAAGIAAGGEMVRGEQVRPRQGDVLQLPA
jgi:hypothetical protein